MIRSKLILILGLLLSCGALLAQEATLEEVLQKHYEAIGGIDAWKGLKSMKATGTMTMGPGMEAPVTMYAKRPDKIRIDFTVQGMTGSQAFDGTTAWMLMPFMGKTDPEDIPQDQAKELKYEADIDGPLVGYQDEGQELKLIGTEEVEGTSVYKIEVTRDDGNVQYIYLDSDYYIPIKTEGKRTIQGNEIHFETTLGDYKEVGGLMMPHSIQSVAKEMGGGQTITIESIEVNTEIEDSFFTKPEKKVEEKKP